MNVDQLVAENEALHGLLAHACHVLHELAERGCSCEDCFTREKTRARDVLAQITEGVVT